MSKDNMPVWYEKQTLERIQALTGLSKAHIDRWIQRNPPPNYWRAGVYAWAFLEMPVDRISIFFRKKFLKYPD